MTSLREQFGDIDIYLFDQLLRGRILPGMRVVDAGCGSGRNLPYFLRTGFEVFGSDLDPFAIEQTRRLAAALAPSLPSSNFRIESVEAMSYPDSFAQVLISSAVLHFAADEVRFRSMLNEMWRVLKPGGIFFCRLASCVALKHRRVGGRRFISPDGAERFLVDEPFLMNLTAELSGILLDPLRTTIVQEQRCMTTWILQKPLLPTTLVSC